MQKSLRKGCFDKMDKIKEDMINAEERGEFEMKSLTEFLDKLAGEKL